MSRTHQTRTTATANTPKAKSRFAAPPVIQPKTQPHTVASPPTLQPNSPQTVNPFPELLQTMQVQAKLNIGQPNDKYEQEADRVAHAVVQRLHAPIHNEVEPGPVINLKPSLQRKLPPKEEAKLQELIKQQKKAEAENAIQAKPIDAIQRSPNSFAALQTQLASETVIQRMGSTTYNVPNSGNVTAVTRTGGAFWSSSLNKTEKGNLLESVKIARESGVKALTSITGLQTAVQGANSWDEVRHDTKDEFVLQFAGYKSDLATVEKHLPNIKTAIARTNAGLANPVKIVENKSTGNAKEDAALLGYVKRPVKDKDGNLKAVTSGDYSDTDLANQVKLEFLDPAIYPTSMHMNFAKLLNGSVTNAAATVFHEATHKFVHTDDNLGYGNSLGQNNNTTLEQTSTNADCYAWYVVSHK